MSKEVILSLKSKKRDWKRSAQTGSIQTEYCTQGLSASGIICEQLLLRNSTCGQALKSENVLKPRDICWRKGFCVISVSPKFVNTEEWRKAVLFLQVIGPAHKGRSNISAKVLPLQNWGKAFFVSCRDITGKFRETGGNELKIRHGLGTEKAVSWGDVQGDP